MNSKFKNQLFLITDVCSDMCKLVLCVNLCSVESIVRFCIHILIGCMSVVSAINHFIFSSYHCTCAKVAVSQLSLENSNKPD